MGNRKATSDSGQRTVLIGVRFDVYADEYTVKVGGRIISRTVDASELRWYLMGMFDVILNEPGVTGAHVYLVNYDDWKFHSGGQMAPKLYHDEVRGALDEVGLWNVGMSPELEMYRVMGSGDDLFTEKKLVEYEKEVGMALPVLGRTNQ